jgi:hypothetical protein
VAAGVASAHQAGAALTAIVSEIDQLGQMVASIAAAARLQTEASGQVRDSIGQIARVSTEAASGAQESARACQALSHLALELEDMVSRFHVTERSAPIKTVRTPHRSQEGSQTGFAGLRMRRDCGPGVSRAKSGRAIPPANTAASPAEPGWLEAGRDPRPRRRHAEAYSTNASGRGDVFSGRGRPVPIGSRCVSGL